MKREMGAICPIGSHFVRTHKRRIQKGFTMVDAHCRKNPKNKKKMLFASNLRYLYINSKKQYSKLKAIKGFKGFHEFDPIIHFWTDYWKSKKIIPQNLDPLLIKAIIASESSFRPKIISPNPNSTAAGLMQVLKTTLPILKGKPQKNGHIEIKANQLDISYNELLDPIINLAAGIRWLGYKIKSSPSRISKKESDKIYGGVKYYHSWDKEGEDYANKVFKLLQDTKQK